MKEETEQGKFYGVCLECDYEDDLQNFDRDSEPDEFYGRDRVYPVCPKCSGGVEVYSLSND